jgi:hypothetical protein
MGSILELVNALASKWLELSFGGSIGINKEKKILAPCRGSNFTST